MSTKHHNDNDVQFLRYGVRQTKFFCRFGPFFSLLPPPLPNGPEYQNFEKMKKMLADIIPCVPCVP